MTDEQVERMTRTEWDQRINDYFSARWTREEEQGE